MQPQPAPPKVTPKPGDRVKVSTTQGFGVIIEDSKDCMRYKVTYDMWARHGVGSCGLGMV